MVRGIFDFEGNEFFSPDDCLSREKMFGEYT
jgi:hypothetical protein